VTVLVFKDNYAARTFNLSLNWINRLGILLGIFLALTLVSGFLAIKYYRISLLSTPTRDLELDQLDKNSTSLPALPSVSKVITPAVPIPSIEPATQKVTPPPLVQAIYQFSGFSDTHLGTIPAPADLSFSVKNPRLEWKEGTLLVQFALQYIKSDQESQQGRIVILARGPDSILAYPHGILSLPGKTPLVSPDKGEFFSVSRYREVKATFGPLMSRENISSVEIFIFNTDGKILVYQNVTSIPKRNTEANPIESTTSNE
jgi:hypothetical protein